MRGTGQESWAKFVVGNSKEVLTRCKPLAPDPLRGHPIHLKLLDERGARGTLKQLARLGETFVISDEGVALSVVRVFDDGRLVREISPGRESGAPCPTDQCGGNECRVTAEEETASTDHLTGSRVSIFELC